MKLTGPQVELELPNSFRLRHLQENVRVLLPDQVELINVPVPEFEDGDPADIVHDFQRVRWHGAGGCHPSLMSAVLMTTIYFYSMIYLRPLFISKAY